MQTLDFNLIKRHYLPVTLNNEKKTHIDIMTPTKKMFDVIQSLPDLDGDITPDDLDLIYTAVARLMSENKQRIRIEAEELKKCLDYDDLALFMAAYVAFLAEITSEKN